MVGAILRHVTVQKFLLRRWVVVERRLLLTQLRTLYAPPQPTRPAATTSYETLRRHQPMHTTQVIPGQRTSEEKIDSSTSVHVHSEDCIQLFEQQYTCTCSAASYRIFPKLCSRRRNASTKTITSQTPTPKSRAKTLFSVHFTLVQSECRVALLTHWISLDPLANLGVQVPASLAGFYCEQISIDFKEKGSLKKHLLIHSEQRKYKCDVCDKSFNLKSNFDSHLLGHSEQRKYKCDICDKSFKVKSNLYTHLLSHSEQRQYKCDVCDKTFKVKSNLYSHLLSHSEQRKYKCNVCEKSFKLKSNLNSHLLSHSEQRKYKCDVCDKDFKVNGVLKRHLLVHSEQRNYKCDVCNKGFKVNNSLKRHRLIHSEQRNYN
uniref:C2H2-type domain-containing protein n=1 Tax=Timema monikensis TaxID=170555 RepID=A0A7R9ELD0_9NEOP|nr:unnamed protein product [Timema monikensis]